MSLPRVPLTLWAFPENQTWVLVAGGFATVTGTDAVTGHHDHQPIATIVAHDH